MELETIERLGLQEELLPTAFGQPFLRHPCRRHDGEDYLSTEFDRRVAAREIDVLTAAAGNGSEQDIPSWVTLRISPQTKRTPPSGLWCRRMTDR